MKNTIRYIAGLAALAFHAPVLAQAGACELHVWPAERMMSLTTGLLGGGLVDIALHAERDATNKSLMATALDSPTQLEALQKLDLRAGLNLAPGTIVVRHEQPLERHTMNSIKTRRADSKSACYSELIVADLSYQKKAVYGRSLHTLFMFRKFDAQNKIVYEYKGWGGNGLKLFPPKEGADSAAALTELSNVFQQNFQEYSNNLKKNLSGKNI